MLRVLTLLFILALAPPLSAKTLTILAFGDSLTAGYGLGPGEGFPERLEAALKARGHDVKVLNAGVSGDTTAAARERLDWAMDPSVGAVIVELGGNDALRGLSPEETRRALDGILGALEARGIPVLLAGMLAPPNLGAEYSQKFSAIYSDLAAGHGALLYPFFLEGVAADPALNQADGIHPNSQGVDVIVARILPIVETLIAKAAAR